MWNMKLQLYPQYFDYNHRAQQILFVLDFIDIDIDDSTDPLTYTVVTFKYILLYTFYLKMATDRGRNML
jgi:hypothetical protein